MANEAGILEIARQVVRLATTAGAQQCDVYAVRYDETEVTVRLGETEKLVEAGSRSLGLRVITGGRTAVCSTSDFSEESLARLAADTVQLARISAPDEFAGLPDPDAFARATGGELQLYDEAVEALTTEEKIRIAISCEDAARRFDARITNSDGASIATRSGETALANSLGFASAYPSTMVQLAVEVMADDADGKKRNAHWFSSERLLHRLLDPEEVGRIAARRALDQVGARKVATKEVPVVFEPMTAVGLMGDLAGCVSGSALYRGATFLATRKGATIASDLVTIFDDATSPGRRGSRPFDGEGVTARRNVLVDEGVFQAFLFDSYTGRRTGNATTGSAGRGVESLPAPVTSNLVWQAGETPAEEMIAGVKEGLYVRALMGFGFNPTTGDFSRGAAGFWIEDGRIAYPVTEVNISGQMPEMLANIDAVGDDLTWFGGAAAPTVRISKMMVSGT